MTLVVVPVRAKPWTSSSGPTRYSWGIAPTNMPVRVPRTAAGSMPARSKASQEDSSSSRCCGSMASASRGEIPKKEASNSAASCRKPPEKSPASSAACSQPRSAGALVMPSPSAASRDQSSSGLRTPPGKRQLMPTIAIGSRAAASSSPTRCRERRRSALARFR